MEHRSVSSTNLKSVAYDSDLSTLQIKFHHGGLYNYFNVPESVWRSLMGASSKGKFHHRRIEGRYRFRKVG